MQQQQQQTPPCDSDGEKAVVAVMRAAQTNTKRLGAVAPQTQQTHITHLFLDIHVIFGAKA